MFFVKIIIDNGSFDSSKAEQIMGTNVTTGHLRSPDTWFGQTNFV